MRNYFMKTKVPFLVVALFVIAGIILFLHRGTTSDGMVMIPSGSFTMGDTLDGWRDAIPTNVTLPAFYMDVNLVTLNQWKLVYNWATNHGYGFDNAGSDGIDNSGSGRGTNYPVMGVDWYDCLKWCNARSQQAGLVPVYFTEAGLTKVYTNGMVIPFVNWTVNGYHLPTEAEWEKAARGGLIGKRFPWGDTISESQANYQSDAGDNFEVRGMRIVAPGYDLGPNGYNAIGGRLGGTTPVGSFPPNGYGLYDMAGNLSEWCWDLYGIENDRVTRGGNWSYYAVSARCAARVRGEPSGSYAIFGFRCVRKR
jgi:formylglycine-generating enzyme required for sulfatase activity